jgi:hypothetical protein
MLSDLPQFAQGPAVVHHKFILVPSDVLLALRVTRIRKRSKCLSQSQTCDSHSQRAMVWHRFADVKHDKITDGVDNINARM